MGNEASVGPSDEVYREDDLTELESRVSPRISQKPQVEPIKSPRNNKKVEFFSQDKGDIVIDSNSRVKLKSQEDSKLEDIPGLVQNINSKPPPDNFEKAPVVIEQEQKDAMLSQVEDSKNEDDDMKLTDVLFQFIPYYGQGNSSNDSTVRAALSGLSIEDIDSRDEYGNTLLLLACTYKCDDLVRIMLNKGADPNAINSSGACCLHFACYGESASYKSAKLLLQNGANPEVIETSYGCTPLHYCASSGSLEFCKLLLSHGAQVSTLDYYNYTCVDYAREASATELETYLQLRLEKFNKQNNLRNFDMTFSGPEPTVDLHGWARHQDLNTGNYYYVLNSTGECLWEHDWKERMLKEYPPAPAAAPAPPSASPAPAAAAPSPAPAPSVNQDWVIAQATRTRLIAFLSRHDPGRLADLEAMLEQYKGKEQLMLKDLCSQYSVSEDPEFAAFQAKINELKGDSGVGSSGTPKKVGDLRVSTDIAGSPIPASIAPSPTAANRGRGGSASSRPGTAARSRGSEGGSVVYGMDPAAVQALVAEEKQKFETKLTEERVTFRLTITEQESKIADLQSELDAAVRAKTALDGELNSVQQRLDRAQLQGGEALSQAENEVSTLQQEIAELKNQISILREDLQTKAAKIKSLEDTLASLTAGHEERIAMERSAAEEREKLAREIDQQHRNELRDAEDQRKAVESKGKADLAKARSEWQSKEEGLKDKMDQIRRAKDIEIEALKRELAERKAKFAQEIGALTTELEQNKQIAEAAVQRANAAEELQRSMADEITEARAIQGFNAQLHKDLAREQVARKRLHNEMEDLKGRIRVYVRVRPLSRTELDKGCSEAVLKDGKLSVVVKGTGPDGKKIFDFDQVFGGGEGNTQTDIFRDTKHLMMSVLDGFNVCIFAYGQTGAGKSYTMIGGSDIGTCLQENGDFDESAGITPRAVSEIFRLLNERHAQITYTVEVQMFQLYRDGLEDLLMETKKKKKGQPVDEDAVGGGKLKITLAEHSPTGLVQVEGAVTMTAATPADVMRIFAAGSGRRTTTATLMNAESSRSHLICSLVVKMTNRRNETTTVGKLTLVDLAGSERIDKSGAEGDVMKEAQSINKSLSALGDVIAALTTGGNKHVPYRNHPLTMLMSDSIGGNAKTLMFVNTSPADYNVPETVSSLGFASRCKDITNSGVSSGPGAQAAQVQALKKELAKLKKSGPGKPGAALGSSGLVRPG